MTANAASRAIRYLRRVTLRQDGAGLTDGELMEQYVTRRDEAAFEALVHRHGPMVLGVCRRILRNEADAEDAFQATFLVFVRKAASIRSRGTVSNWLYGVAHNTALKAKAMNRKRHVKEREATAMPLHEARAEVWQEVQALLDAELSKLPERYRIPIVLCDLEGKTIKEAARHLGWPQGTVATRLTRGRAELAKRIAKHGLTLSAGVMTAVISHGAASATVPMVLINSTTKAASLIAATGQAAIAGVVTAKVAVLTEGMMKSMLLTKLKIVSALVLAMGLIGVSWGAYQTRPAAPEESRSITKAPAGCAASGTVPGDPGTKPDENNAKADEDTTNLPRGKAPIQVLVSLDKDGKLVVKTAVTTIHVNGAPEPGPETSSADKAPGVGGIGGPVRGKAARTLRAQTYDLDDVEVLDTKGRKVDKKELAKFLKKESVAMASHPGESVDPLHLRILKDGTLTFVLPAPKGDIAPVGP